jgi:transposase
MALGLRDSATLLVNAREGGSNSKLHAVCVDTSKPVRLLLTEGQASDYTGARYLLPSLSQAKHMIADRGYDADWLTAALKKQRVKPCILPRKNQKEQRRYCKTLYMQYDRCAPTFFSAICIAATGIIYLKE